MTENAGDAYIEKLERVFMLCALGWTVAEAYGADGKAQRYIDDGCVVVAKMARLLMSDTDEILSGFADKYSYEFGLLAEIDKELRRGY